MFPDMVVDIVYHVSEIPAVCLVQFPFIQNVVAQLNVPDDR
jgi:hypothetical protein